MKIFDNITDIVWDDLKETIQRGSKVAIAAACFSMYAYKELKRQLEQIEKFRFIFTSPTFVQEGAEKQRRGFYISRLSRGTSLYGTEFEQYNGCILADSVGLGKTFTAFAVIKYYENRNKSVLVLCPQKLAENWNTYKDNYVNNPIAADRLNYDVLFHTDLSRTGGTSNGLDIDRLNWGNYDLVVIDEPHNFRNGAGTHANTQENRYIRLMLLLK